MRRRRLKLALALGAVLLASGCDESGNSSGPDSARVNSEASSASSAGTSNSSSREASGSSSSGSAGILDASWNAPTTNSDGSSLTKLAFYRVYYGTTSTPCPGWSFFQIASQTRSPQIDEAVTFRLTGLWAAVRYFVAVTAVNSD